MIVGALLLIGAAQGSLADYNRNQAIKQVSSVEMKLFDMRKEARCLQCRGDVDVDHDLAFSKKCVIECFTTRPAFIELIATARYSDKPCDPYKVAKIVLRHDDRLRSLVTVDYTGQCISIEAVDHRANGNVLEAIMRDVDTSW